jgi:hypothetical protein
MTQSIVMTLSAGDRLVRIMRDLGFSQEDGAMLAFRAVTLGNQDHKRAAMLASHPEPVPDDLVGPLPYLVHPPGKLSSTDRWISFRDKTLRPMMLMHPDDRNLPKFLRRAEEILAWREAVPREWQVWKPAV